jgi:hypothetical protein
MILNSSFFTGIQGAEAKRRASIWIFESMVQFDVGRNKNRPVLPGGFFVSQS